ncbi:MULTISPECIES: hypothetical protein [unclassified Myxococcus]|uniref:hypothetical protein n=1 Tax=unclassified Myxococcus TaxID=2648731 RepID=UPI001CBE7FC9|nr:MULTISPECIES: hypothetical protein [unclassified Myxococcus]MBZ4401617.1 hypothetical protein [Myxococcus sp. AS-1-15]
MQPVKNNQVDAVRRDAGQLRRLCEQLLPRFASTRHPVRLSERAPTLVRAFWEELGYSPALKFLVSSPEDEEVLAATRLLEKWRGKASRRKGPGVEAEAGLVPASFRVVSVNAEEHELFIADESGGDVDPPVLVLSSGGLERMKFSDSYLRFVTLEILRLAFSVGPTRCTMAFSPPLVGTPAFPVLAPSALSLGEGLWKIVPEPAVGPVGEPAEFIGYTSLDRFVSYLHGLCEHAISYTGRPRGDLVTVEGVSDESMQALALKWFSWTFQKRPQRLGVGKVGGVEVSVDPIGPQMYCFRVTPEARKALLKWVEKQGFRVRDVTPWKEQFAIPGGVSFD